MTSVSKNSLIIRNEIDLTGNINSNYSYASNITNSSKDVMLLDSGVSTALSKNNNATIWYLYYFNNNSNIEIHLNDFADITSFTDYFKSNILNYKLDLYNNRSSIEITDNNFRVIQC